MILTLNGQSSFNDMICLTNAPTIFKATGSQSGTSTPTKYVITVGSPSVNPTSEYWIDVDGVKIYGTQDTKQNGLKFYWVSTSSTSVRSKIASSIATALKRIPRVLADFKVYANNGVVTMESYEKANVECSVTTNITSYLTISRTAGSSASDLVDGSLKIDVYKSATAPKFRTNPSTLGEYICTLDKTMMGDDIAYELGRVFGSYTKDGELSHFQLRVYKETDTEVNEVATYYSIYNANGYMVNQGGEYLSGVVGQTKFAGNVNRGKTREYLNNSILYVYEPSIDLSVFCGNVSRISFYIQYITSSTSTAYYETIVRNVTAPLMHYNIPLRQDKMLESKFISVTIAMNYSIKYDIIKPVKAAAESQRVYWYNSYGGISFFDFTGERSEERKTSTTTYEKSLLGYYDTDINEKNVTYSKTNDITVTLRSHHITKDGQWALFDLQNSRNVWTIVNGNKYRINIGDITISKTNVSDIYTCDVKYTYSMGDNI